MTVEIQLQEGLLLKVYLGIALNPIGEILKKQEE